MAVNQYNAWTVKEIKYILDNYEKQTAEEIGRAINRSASAVTVRQSIELRKLGKGKRQVQRKTQGNVCPKCGRESQNEILTVKTTNIIHAWWCKNCLVEFYKGKVLPYID